MVSPCLAQGGDGSAGATTTVEERLHELLRAAFDGADADTAGADPSEELVALHSAMQILEGRRLVLMDAMDRAVTWALAGYASPAAWMVANLGMSRAAGGSIRRVCAAAAERPFVRAAAVAGRLSHEHLRVLMDARRRPVIACWDRDEEALVEAACRLSVDGLRLHLAAWYQDALVEVAENEPDGPPPPSSEGNRFRLRGGFAGRGLIDGELTPEARAAVQARLDAGYERLLTAGALDNDPRSLDEVYGDLFAELFESGGVGGSAVEAHVSAVVDLDTLLTRAGAAAPTDRMARRAEIVGVGPVADDVIAELCEHAHISLLVTDRGNALWFGRARRLASAAQRAAAIAVSGGVCSFPGCGLGAQRCQIDHLVGWEDGGGTDQPNLAPLCRFHNRLKHRMKLRAERLADGTIGWTTASGIPVTVRWLHRLPHHMLQPAATNLTDRQVPP